MPLLVSTLRLSWSFVAAAFVKPLPEATPRYMFERVFDSVVEMVAVKPCSARMV